MKNALLAELNETIPSAEVSLPTRAAFYHEGVLDPHANPEEIEIHTLSLVDEQRYKDPFMLVSGRAVQHMVRRIAPAILQPQELCEIDLEAILLVARIVSYGPELVVSHKCQNATPAQVKIGDIPQFEEDGSPKVGRCDHDNAVKIDLQQFILRYEPINDIQEFSLALPIVGQTVQLRPITHKAAMGLMRYLIQHAKQVQQFDEIDPEQFVAQPETLARYDTFIEASIDVRTDVLLEMIFSVTAKSGEIFYDAAVIREWLMMLPPIDFKAISDRANELINRTRQINVLEYNCQNCGHENSFNLMMNPDELFFSEPEASRTPLMSSGVSESIKTRPTKPSRTSRNSPLPSTGRSTTRR